MNLTQSSQQKGKQVVETVKTVQCRIIDCKTSPKPSNNACSNKRLRTCQTSNYSSSPLTHLTPRQYIPNKRCQNHYQQNNNTNQPNKFTRLCITCIVQTTELVSIHHNEKQRSSICMQITQKPSIRNITHQMLNTLKCLINMCGIMHCLENSCQNLQNQTQTCLNSPIVISIQIRGSRITNQMILDHCQDRLIPQTSTQLFHISSHWKNKKHLKRFLFNWKKIKKDIKTLEKNNSLFF